MITWSRLRELVSHGAQVSVKATLRLHGGFGRTEYGWMMVGERCTPVVLEPGEYDLVFQGRRTAVSQAGVPRLVDDGDRAIVMTGGEPLDAASEPTVVTSARWFFDRESLVRSLDELFPGGPVERVTCAGRSAYRIPAVTQRRTAANQRGDLPGSCISITVDTRTGVLLAVENTDGGGELLRLDAPDNCHDAVNDEAFMWDAATYGTPRCPDPWRPDPWCPDPRHSESPRCEVESVERQPDVPVTVPEDLPVGHRMMQVTVRPEDRPHDPSLDWVEGKTLELALGFIEEGDNTSPDRWDLPDLIPASTVTAWSEPVYEAEPVDRLNSRTGFRWETVLRGDGWTAHWDADRPTRGYVELTGRFTAHSYGAPWREPTRARVHRIDSRGAQSVLMLDLDAALPVRVGSSRTMPGEIHNFAITCKGTVTPGGTGRETYLWRLEESGLPAVWGTSLESGESRRVLLPVPVPLAARGFTLIGGEDLRVRTCRISGETMVREFLVSCSADDCSVKELPAVAEGDHVMAGSMVADLPGWSTVQEHPAGGLIVLNEQESGDGYFLTQRLGRIEDGCLRWVEEGRPGAASPGRRVFVIEGRIYTGHDHVLTLRDDDLEVVDRRMVPQSVEFLDVRGPWLGCDVPPPRDEEFEVIGPETYQLVDPLTGNIELSVPLVSSEVFTQWLDGELWVADTRLRLFRRDGNGTWSETEVTASSV